MERSAGPLCCVSGWRQMGEQRLARRGREGGAGGTRRERIDAGDVTAWKWTETRTSAEGQQPGWREGGGLQWDIRLEGPGRECRGSRGGGAAGELKPYLQSITGAGLDVWAGQQHVERIYDLVFISLFNTILVAFKRAGGGVGKVERGRKREESPTPRARRTRSLTRCCASPVTRNFIRANASS